MAWTTATVTGLPQTLLTYQSPEFVYTNSIVMFDLDSTLITTKSGNKFPKTSSDWKWLPNVMKKLKQLHTKKISIVIITNQAGKNKKLVKDKLVAIIKKLTVPVVVYCALERDVWRKPHSTIWDRLIKPRLSSYARILAMYIGDAAGRPKDHSAVDIKFAQNSGVSLGPASGSELRFSAKAENLVSFFTPEEYFNDEEPVLGDFGFNPHSIVPSINIHNLDIPDTQELVVFIGYPGCGKSKFAKEYFFDYEVISMDPAISGNKPKTVAATVKLTRTALMAGNSVVIDNTNPDEKARSRYTTIADELGVPVRYVYFEMERELAEHLNFYRESLCSTQGLDGGKRVPTIAYNIFQSRLSLPPTYDVVEFTLQLKDDTQRRFFYQWSE